MKAIDRPFTKIINGSSQFVIPVFQRDYDWTEAECGQLWADILQITRDTRRPSHFMGSIVYIPSDDSAAAFTRWMIIDGQQRVTTLLLLLAALRDHIRETGWEGGEDSPTADQIEAYFLKNVQEKGQRRHKLVLRRHDQDTLRAILEGVELPDVPSQSVRGNYQFFREELVSADPDEVYRGINRLVIVDVTLDRGGDDPQLIFESLNSTGLALSQSDLIRNYLLMRLPDEEQTRLYEQYWSKLEVLFRSSPGTFDAFVRDFLALHLKATKQEKADKIYQAFRRNFAGMVEEYGGLEQVLDQMLRFGRYHAAFSLGTGYISQVAEDLARLRRLVDVPALLVMRLFDCHERVCSLSTSEFREAIRTIESYVFRRAICGEQTRGYWSVFANMAYRIDEERPLESLKVSLALQSDSYKFPADDDFSRELQSRDVYATRVCSFLLERLENHGYNEVTDTSGYTIEHILPQNEKLPLAWREMLGDNWRTLQITWLHRLGNLTLTGYNSTYSDRPFNEKKSIPGGFTVSAVRLNQYVREQPVWTENQMATRGKQLAERSLAIWPPLQVDPTAVEAAKHRALKAKASRSDIAKVPMSTRARELLLAIRDQVLGWDPRIIEVAEPNSVSYHAPGFFLEVLPRKHGVCLLLPLDFSEIDDPRHLAGDATTYTYIVHAKYEGGVLVTISSESDFGDVIPMVRQSFQQAGEMPITT